MLPVIAVMNLIVGTLVGVSGIAGFLLPIVFTGYLGMDLSLSLALSFISFLTSGIIGSYRYQKQGQMDLKFGVLVGIGSIAGAVLGVKLNFMIPLTTAKMFLYLVVLASGLSILVKRINRRLLPLVIPLPLYRLALQFIPDYLATSHSYCCLVLSQALSALFPVQADRFSSCLYWLRLECRFGLLWVSACLTPFSLLFRPVWDTSPIVRRRDFSFSV